LIEVEIFGQTFTVNSEDDENYVRQLASYVDQRMRQVGGTSKTAVPLRVAIMAAMSIADEYYKASRREAEIEQEAARLSSVLLARIEQSEKLDGIAASESTVNAVSATQRVPELEREEKKEILPSS
ncbi:MAG: cell division protein ZapA, partial [Deltaproteobacteria bacterium]|nr:cell division protein ZapA [Deltaproteobacteria bacterium]